MNAGLESLAVSVERGGRKILREVTVHLEPGKFTAIVGPNGSGKSTLLRAMAGLWAVSAGEIRFDGTPLPRLARREIARRIAFVPQDTRIDFAFTVQELVAMGRHPHRGRFQRESGIDRAAVADALRRCDVEHLADRAANELSGGERQRVLIARSLAAQPEVVLLDEPTSSLDIEHALDVLDLCRELARDGRAVAVALHDLNAVARYADLVVLMDEGQVDGTGPVHTVLTPDAIRKVFGVEATALAAPEGEPYFLFHRLPPNPS
jgi:iron complex transport system ATP-binding protein